MVLPAEMHKDIDEVFELFQYNSAYLKSMVENLCEMYPDVDRGDIEQELEGRFGVGSPEAVIPEEDLENALLMGDTESMMDFLMALHPHLTYDEIMDQLESAIASSASSSSRSKKSKKKTTSISDGAVADAIEFYSYQFGPDLREKIVKYLSKEYPTLKRHEIIDQLKGYDFGTPRKEPTHSTSGGSPNPYSFVATPPRRGDTYGPSDFSPSSMGACGPDAMDFLEEKRSKYLPTYLPPTRSPMPPRGIRTPRRFREDFPSPPRTPTRDHVTQTGRRKLSF